MTAEPGGQKTHSIPEGSKPLVEAVRFAHKSLQEKTPIGTGPGQPSASTPPTVTSLTQPGRLVRAVQVSFDSPEAVNRLDQIDQCGSIPKKIIV